ncbi:MAG: hypothetical protein V4632_20375 [Pseudomonadota bacterium]
MATIQMEPGSTYTGHAMHATGDTGRRPLFSAIRWGAVLAGVAVGVSVQLVLTLLGIATGLSATDVASGESVGAGPLIWAGFSMLIAALVGGYVAARMSGLRRKADGILHGVVSWAVTTLLFATLAGSAGGNMLSGIFSAANQNIASSSAGGGGGIADLLRSQLGPNASPAALQTVQQYIRDGRRNDAISYMVGEMGVEQGRATTIVDQALILTGSPEQASPQARAAADRAIGMASNMAWTIFFAVVLSLLMGVIGGALGAIGARRKTWVDTTSPAEMTTRPA